MPSGHFSPLRGRLFASILAFLLVAFLEMMPQAFHLATVGDYLLRHALPPIYVADPIRCYRVASNLEYVHRTNELAIDVFTNSIGMRTLASHREYATPKPDDAYPSLVMGPSFELGCCGKYEDIFPTLIEKGLKVSNRRVDVLKLGTGLGPPALLDREGRRRLPSRPHRPRLLRQRSKPRRDGGTPPPPSSSVRRSRSTGAYRQASTRSIYTKGVTATRTEASFEEMAATDEGQVDFMKGVCGRKSAAAFTWLPYSHAVHPEETVRSPGPTPDHVPRSRARIEAGIEAIEHGGIPILNTLQAPIGASSGKRLDD